MIEMIRTFFGKLRGQHGAKQTIVEEDRLWRCTDCKMVFLMADAAKRHVCTGKI